MDVTKNVYPNKKKKYLFSKIKLKMILNLHKSIVGIYVNIEGNIDDNINPKI